MSSVAVFDEIGFLPVLGERFREEICASCPIALRRGNSFDKCPPKAGLRLKSIGEVRPPHATAASGRKIVSGVKLINATGIVTPAGCESVPTRRLVFRPGWWLTPLADTPAGSSSR